MKARIDKNQREYILREQLKLIREELGEDNTADDAEEFKKKLQELQASDEIKEKISKEIERFKNTNTNVSENAVLRGYIETMLALPWDKKSTDSDDLKEAWKVLQEGHYGLKDVKERVMEFLSVRKLTHKGKSPILCLVGPPGTGKTSIARSVAEAMHKKYVRICLGGVRDEAEIRGHRKTYVGAMPGRITAALQQAGVSNPLMLLHEILGGDVGVVVVLTLLRFLAHVNGLGRAVLQAAEALDAVIAYDCPSVFEADVALWAEHGALTAAYAAVVDAHLCRLELGYFRPALALRRVHGVIGRAAVTAAGGHYLTGNPACKLFRPLLRLVRRERRQHQEVREQPYAGALVRDTCPVIKMYDLVDLIKACAQIARVAANAEGIGVGADLYHFHILLHVAGKPAAVAREHESDSPRIRDICD